MYVIWAALAFATIQVRPKHSLATYFTQIKLYLIMET